MKGTRHRSAEEALMRYVDIQDDGCWIRGGSHCRGYPHLKYRGKQHRAARFAYELYVAPIPSGLTVDHLCRNTFCVNPEHMELVTLGENARRARAAMRPTHCPQGHSYSDHGYEHGGRRHCRECRRIRHRRWVENNRERDNELKRESYARARGRLTVGEVN